MRIGGLLARQAVQAANVVQRFTVCQWCFELFSYVVAVPVVFGTCSRIYGPRHFSYVLRPWWPDADVTRRYAVWWKTSGKVWTPSKIVGTIAGKDDGYEFKPKER